MPRDGSALRIDAQLSAPLGQVGRQARALAEAGFDGAFTFEGPSDVFLPLGEAAAASAGDHRLDLYTNVAIAFPRSPLHLAHLSWDLQRLCQGRFALGLGSQVRAHVERRYGAAFEHPVERMREWVLATKAIFATWQDGVPLEFRGRFTTHTSMPPLFNPGPLDCGPPPIWVGAVGPRMTRMVAEVADGLLVHPFHTEQFLHEGLLATVDDVLTSSRRDRGDFTVGADVIICVGRDEAELATATAGTRGLLAFYGSTPAYRPVLDLHGWGELQPELRELTRAGRWDELAALVPDELVDALSIRGTPDEVGARLRERYAGVVDRVAFSVPYQHEPGLLAAVVAAAKARQ